MNLEEVVRSVVEKYPIEESEVRRQLELLAELMPLEDAVKIVWNNIKPLQLSELRPHQGKFVKLVVKVLRKKRTKKNVNAYVVADESGYGFLFTPKELQVGKVYRINGAIVTEKGVFVSNKAYVGEIDAQINVPEEPVVEGTVAGVSVRETGVRVLLTGNSGLLGWYDLPVSEYFSDEEYEKLMELAKTDAELAKAVVWTRVRNKAENGRIKVPAL